MHGQSELLSLESSSNECFRSWLDSLLDTLGDEDEDFSVDSDIKARIDDDGDKPCNPLISPMSSSDDTIRSTISSTTSSIIQVRAQLPRFTPRSFMRRSTSILLHGVVVGQQLVYYPMFIAILYRLLFHPPFVRSFELDS